MTVFEEARPDYTVKFYREDFYKLIRFRRSDPSAISLVDKTPTGEGEGKLSNNLSRARSVVFQLCVCNDWDWFFTGTLDRRKFDRFSLDGFRKSLAQWIRNLNKKSGFDVKYVLVPEKHKDGAWHMHGLLRGIPSSELSRFVHGVHPERLVDGDYWNWQRYSDKFGFCSLGAVRDPVACSFYLQKYLTKDMSRTSSDYGRHLHFASHRLRRAVPMVDIYGRRSALDAYITAEYDFCATGYVQGVDWRFWIDYFDDYEMITLPVDEPDREEAEPVSVAPPTVCEEWEQMMIT